MYIYDQVLRQDPLYSLDEALVEAGSDYTEEFLAHWNLNGHEAPDWIDGDLWREYLTLYYLSQKLAEGAKTFIRPASVSKVQMNLPRQLADEADREAQHFVEMMMHLRQIVPEDVFHKLWPSLSTDGLDEARAKIRFLKTCLQINLHDSFSVSVSGMADRALWLTNLLVLEPGQFTRAFLSRTALCFVRDMKPELAVMARAVLDVAIQELITDEEVMVEVGESRSGGVDLARRIQACRSLEWFDDHTTRIATLIRERGRDAAHFTPGVEADLDVMVTDLALVLRAIETVRARRAK